MKPAALQESIYDVLVGDAPLLSALSSAWAFDPVFSDVPQVDEAEDPDYYPFISFGDGTTTPFDDKGATGGDAVILVNIWARSNDYIQSKQIAERVTALLHRQPLTISGAGHIATGFESVEYTLDPDGHTRRAMMRFRITYFDN